MVGLSLACKLRLSSASTFGLFALFLAGSITPASAANDWNTPCFNGICQYSLTAAPGQNGSGTVQIWGSSDAISDITPAAGWQILNCSSSEMAQDIRLVCMSADTEAAGCDHLFQSGGAAGKLVRLPENCGMSAFARVANSYIPDDQSIPTNISARFVRRDGNSTVPQVQALSLDTNFAAIDSSKYGNVNIAIQGANFPGADVNGTLVSTSSSRRRNRISSRGLFSFVGNAINSIKNLDNFNVNKSINLPPVSVDKSVTLLNRDLKCGPVDLDLNVAVDGKASAQMSIGVAAQGTIVPPALNDFAAIVNMNAAIDGTLDVNAGISTTFDTGKIEVVPPLGIPGLDFPGILTLGPSFDVSAEATAKLDLAADMKVGLVYNITNAQLVFPDNSSQSGGNFNVGNTPLTLSLTPSVKSTGSLTAHLIPSLNLGVQALDNAASATIFLDLDASATMQLSLDAVDSNSITINGGSSNSSSTNSTATTTSSASNSTSAASNSTSTSIASTSNSTSTNAAATATRSTSNSTSAASHSTSSTTSQSVNSTSTSVASASNSVSNVVYSSAAASKRNSKRSTVALSTKPTSIAQAVSSAKRASMYASGNASATLSNQNSTSNSSSGSVSTSSTGLEFGGCIEIDTGLAVNAGAQGTFFKLFDASVQVPLFSKEFVLFKKCFGNTTATKRTLPYPLDLRAPSTEIGQLYNRAAAVAAAPVASNSTASSTQSCLASSLAPPIPIAANIQIGSASITVKPA